jgi:dolichol-phosphate mannosyltransferase
MLDSIGDVRIEPGSADFMLLDREVVDTVNALQDQDVFLRALVRWLGFPTKSIAFARGARIHGDSKYTLRRMVDLAVTGIAAHSVRPLRLAIWLSLGLAALGLLLLAYTIFSYVFVSDTVHGWTSVMATIAILGAAQLLVLGIIGEYVGRILREARGRPAYIVAETETETDRARGTVTPLKQPAE